MIGIDEVGRGCLAGPLLVVAARKLSKLPPGLKDSKQMTGRQRQSIFEQIISSAKFGEGWVASSEIDNRGLTGAIRLGVTRALRGLDVGHHEKIIIDGPVNYLPKIYKNFECLIKADTLVPIVSAASIYAKVQRDQYMMKLAKKYISYGFESHVGYYTPQHKLALQRYGPLASVHRLSFRPLRGTG